MRSLIATLLLPALTLAQIPRTQQLLNTSLTPAELVHTFNDEWPTGVTVSRSGRIFACYPRSDPNNTAYTVAELLLNNTASNLTSSSSSTVSTGETPFPNATFNNPINGLFLNSSAGPAGSADSNALISVQSVVIDPLDRLWILDTGRPTLTTAMVPSTPGGPKMVAVNLTTNEVIRTITFPATVVHPETTFLNDIRFDLRSNLTGTSGQGVAYITDASEEGTPGIIIVDLGTGNSWRKLTNHPSVQPDPGFVGIIDGRPYYAQATPQDAPSFTNTGSDGIAIAADGELLYYSPLSSRRLHAVPTALLRNQNGSEVLAEDAVKNLGQKAMSDGLETDSNGLIYAGILEQNGVQVYDPATGLLSPFVVDPRIQWPDTFSVADDGFIYFTSNQLHLRPGNNGGVDLRQRPFGLFRARTVNGGQRVRLM